MQNIVGLFKLHGEFAKCSANFLCGFIKKKKAPNYITVT